MSTNTNRAAIYTRISVDRTGRQLGTHRQLEDCQKLAADHGLEVVKHYDDNNRSAFNGKVRKDFEAMLTAALAGGFDHVIVWDDDRLHRDIWDYARMVRARLNILTVTSGPMDLGDAAGQSCWVPCKGGMAVYESRHKSQRAVRESRQRAERGIPRWRNSFGYAHDGQPPTQPRHLAVCGGGIQADLARRLAGDGVQIPQRLRRAD